MALQVQDKRYLILFLKNSSFKDKNNLAFHPGPVQPPSGEGSPLDIDLLYVENRESNVSSEFLAIVTIMADLLVLVFTVVILAGFFPNILSFVFTNCVTSAWKKLTGKSL